MSKGTLQITILGTSFSIQANEDSLYLEKILQYYRKIVDQVSHTTSLQDPIKIAVLAGIMVTDELFKEQRNSSDTDTLLTSAELSEAEKITLSMIKKIDQVLE